MTLIDSEALKTFLMKAENDSIRNLKEAFDIGMVRSQQGKLQIITLITGEINRLEKCQK